MAIQWIFSAYMSFAIIIPITIGMGIYSFVIAITDDVKDILKAIDENSRIKKGRKQIFNQFIEFIDSHAATKQLSFTKKNCT